MRPSRRRQHSCMWATWYHQNEWTKMNVLQKSKVSQIDHKELLQFEFVCFATKMIIVNESEPVCRRKCFTNSCPDLCSIDRCRRAFGSRLSYRSRDLLWTLRHYWSGIGTLWKFLIWFACHLHPNTQKLNLNNFNRTNVLVKSFTLKCY